MQAAQFVESYFDAWNQRDARAVAEHLVKNGMYSDIPANSQYSREDLIANLVGFFSLKQHSYQLIGEVLSSETSIAFQYKMTPSDKSAPDWYGSEFMTVEGDGALKITDYYDPMHYQRRAAESSNDLSIPKYAKSGLSGEQMEKYTSQLKSLMDQDRVFLESDLTMNKLASLVDCSVNHLSQAVNSGFGMSFFDFLHSYRIEEAKNLLCSNDLHSKAILDVSFAVGFNSNSAFYAAFKKSTGQTPAQFRRDYLATLSRH